MINKKTWMSLLSAVLLACAPYHTCASEDNDVIKATPACASCPLAEKKYMVNMNNPEWCPKTGTSDKKTGGPEITDSKLREELRRRNMRAQSIDSAYRKKEAEEAEKRRRREEWTGRLEKTEEWFKKNLPAAIRVRDRITAGIDELKWKTGQKHVIINGERYMEKDGEFIKMEKEGR
ncbi:MAG: hypothetical protein WC515_03710 [Candidatus Omnitrophota bacterium]